MMKTKFETACIVISAIVLYACGGSGTGVQTTILELMESAPITSAAAVVIGS